MLGLLSQEKTPIWFLRISKSFMFPLSLHGTFVCAIPEPESSKADHAGLLPRPGPGGCQDGVGRVQLPRQDLQQITLKLICHNLRCLFYITE